MKRSDLCPCLIAFATLIVATHGESQPESPATRGGTGSRPVVLLTNPFNRQSAHHRPIGTGAVYGLPPDRVRTRGRLSVITEVSLAPASGIK